jgi:hypothetical protein
MNHSTVVIKPHESLQQSADSHAVMDASKETLTQDLEQFQKKDSKKNG